MNLKKKIILKKDHFFFGNIIKDSDNNIIKTPLKAIFIINMSYSNIFFTLVDLNGKIISTKSTGFAKVGNSKKKKLSTQTIEILVNQFLFYLNLYKITSLSIVLKIRVNKFIWSFIYKLIYYGLTINSFIINRRIAHNGMRLRKMRRI